MVNYDRAIIAERIDLTAELAIFRLAPEKKFDFIPGQFATLALDIGGELVPRPYSLCSAPHEPMLEFFVELVPDGAFTPYLWGLQTGSEIFLRPDAVGNFRLDQKSGLRRHLMIATVTGIAPYVSMVRHQAYQLERGQSEPYEFAILQGASRSRELEYYLNELMIVARQGWVTYVPTVSRHNEDPEWLGEVGRVDDVVRKYADQLGFNHTNAVAYACGHPGMIDNVRSILHRARFGRKQVKIERYFILKDTQ